MPLWLRPLSNDDEAPDPFDHDLMNHKYNTTHGGILPHRTLSRAREGRASWERRIEVRPDINEEDRLWHINPSDNTFPR